MNERYRRILVDGVPCIELGCRACGDHYFVHAAASIIEDSGLCISCENEVQQLESAYCTSAGELR